MTPEAQSLLERLIKNYKKAAFWAENYEVYVKRNEIPKAGITLKDLYLPGDGWNAGHDRRIFIPKNTGMILIVSKDTYKLGIGGVDTDKLVGLWASKFQYGWGSFNTFEPDGDFIVI